MNARCIDAVSTIDHKIGSEDKLIGLAPRSQRRIRAEMSERFVKCEMSASAEKL
jgi:hypothetical protein